MAKDSETFMARKARADRIQQARMGHEARYVSADRLGLDEQESGRAIEPNGYLMRIRNVFRFAEIES